MRLIAGNVDLSINQGNDLIYYCAAGEQYISEAAISIRSLRDIGQFRGNIILFTSKSQVVPSLPCDVIRVECDDWASLRFTVNYDFSKYNRVMYLDADIVCIKPIHLLLDKHKTGLVSIVQEHYTMRKWQKKLKYYFSDNEIKSIMDDKIINSGTVICDGNKCRDLFLKWMGIYNLSNDPDDQTALHRMYYNDKSQFNVLTRGIVSMPRQEGEHRSCVLLHYCGMKLNRLDKMRSLFPL